MRTVALVVAVAVALSSTSAFADDAPKQRGFLSGLGIGLLVLSGAGFGVGAANVVRATDLNTQLVAYVGEDGKTLPSSDESSRVAMLQKAREDAWVSSGILMGVGAAAAIAGIILLVLDAPPPVLVTFTPTPQGGAFSLSATF